MEGPAKLGIIVAVISIALFGGLIVLDKNKNATGEEPMGTKFEDQGREHIAVGAEHVTYNSNPPTSGPHYAQEADWGVYDSPLPDEQLIHNLEHGGVNIFYKPDAVDQAAIDKLKAIQKDFATKTVLAPRPQGDKPLALSSWNYALTMDSLDEATVREFIRRNKNKAPEFFPD